MRKGNQMRSSLFLALVASAIVFQVSNALASVVYSNNFETNTAGFSAGAQVAQPTDGSPFSSPTMTSTFLGEFGGNSSTVLSLPGLTSGQTYTLEFDLFIGRSWDGNAINDVSPSVVGPDQWRLTGTGITGGTLVDTTFNNLNPSDGRLDNYTQNYSDSNPIGPGTNVSFTGADIMYNNASLHWYTRYAIYYFSHGSGNPVLSFTSTGTSVSLTFAGIGLQDSPDEFWALDNVVVSSQVANVPEPDSMLLSSVGVAVCAFPRLRRIRPSVVRSLNPFQG